MPTLKEELHQRRQRIFTPQRRQASPFEAVHAFTREADLLMRHLFQQNVQKHPVLKTACLVALGGYGRGELCPYSDIDILVLHHGRGNRQTIESFVQNMWDMGLAIGCVVRTLSECAAILGDDPATDNAFLECEYLAGDSDMYFSLRRSVLRPYFRKRRRAYIAQACRELHERVYSSVNTLYRVEPDLKNGLCALRDCQRIIWAERVNDLSFGGKTQPEFKMLGPEEKDQFLAAYEFLLGLRTELHMLCGRRLDVLELGLQGQVAESMGLGTDGARHLMERYFRAVTDVKHGILSFLERAPYGGSVWETVRRKVSSFSVSPGIAVVDGILFPTRPEPPPARAPSLWMLKVFGDAISCRAVLSIGLRNTIRRMVEKLPPEAFRNQAIDRGFRKILSRHQQVGRILQLMHETSFLEGMIPEFGTLTCRVEYDSYHEYTVDQHTLLALCALDMLSSEPDDLIRRIYLNLPRQELLRIALLLHDIGKAMPGDHCRSGAVIAETIAERLGYSEEEIQRIRFLVYNHLAMSELSLRREPEEELIEAFAERVQDQENLDLLYLLTVLDIRHVGSKTWTGWKAAQLADIYQKTSATLRNGGRPLPASAENAPKGVEDSGYLRHTLPEERNDHRSWLATLQPGELQLQAESFVGFDRLTVLAHDRKNFLADFVGCLYAEGLQVLHAHIHSTNDGKLLDVFNLQCDDVTRLSFDERIQGVQRRWRKIVDGKAQAEDMVAERIRRYPPKPIRPASRKSRVGINNDISPRYTVLEVNVPESAGLLHRIVSTLAAHNVAIASASISTLVDQARDVFYLTDADNRKIDDPQTCQAIRTAVAALFDL